MDVLLSGIVGSTAYGLATPESDVDRLGIFVTPTERLLGLHPPPESVVSTSPDRTMHEAIKYVRLALNVNPTVTELLWLPDALYETRTPFGDDLLSIRHAFLSADRVREAYFGYASGQFRRLASRLDEAPRKRTRKHARHLARLVHQGRALYATGRLTVELDDPQWYRDFGERVADGDLEAARKLLADAEADLERTTSPLPARPDEEAAERWLLAVRAAH